MMKKRLLPTLLACLTALALLPLTAGTVFAASGDHAMNLGTAVLMQNANKTNAESVWYADSNWFVIGYNSTTAINEPGAATLLSAGNLEQSVFNKYIEDGNHYSGSVLEEKVNSILNRFTLGEQGAIKTRTLACGEYNDDEPWCTDCIMGDADLTDVALWPLSTDEAGFVTRNLRIIDPENTESVANNWRLRSPGEYFFYSAYVQSNGEVIYRGDEVDCVYGVRPAFHLNINSVLFTSVAEGGKTSGTIGVDALITQSDLTNSGNEWKVTVKDNDHAGFAISKTMRTEKGVIVIYTGAATGEDEYISAIITDKPITESGATIKYYGRIATASGADNAYVKINTADKLGENDHLYVFNEQYNGDKKTDYASELSEVTIPELMSYTVTFNSAGGTWADGTAADKEVFVEEGNAATAPTIPTKKGFTFDGWDTKYSNVTSDLTVTARWKESIKIAIPTGKTLTYNGKAQTGVAAGTGYTLSGTMSATNVGNYTAKAALKTDANYTYKWSDDTTAAKTVNWKINKATAKVAVPTGKTLTYNGSTQTGVASGAKYTLSGTTKATKAGSYTAKAALKTDANYTYKWSDGTTAAKTINWKISPASLKDKKLVLTKTAYTWNGKVQKPTVKTVGGKALKSGTDYTVKYSNASSKAVGSYTVTVTGKGNYTGTSAKATYKINKAANPLAVKAATATVKYSALKTANQTLGVTKVITFSKKGQGTMSYSKTSGNAKITINKTTGKITVKKGLAKGTYKVKLTAKAAGNANYKASAVKTVTSTIVVK